MSGVILIVEDDAAIRTTLAEFLESEGYAVEQAEDGRRALEKLDAMHPPPALVLLDMMMPEMTGAQVLDILHARAAVPELPVVVVSAALVTTRQMRGARAVLQKPMTLGALMRVVQAFCGPP